MLEEVTISVVCAFSSSSTSLVRQGPLFQIYRVQCDFTCFHEVKVVTTSSVCVQSFFKDLCYMNG